MRVFLLSFIVLTGITFSHAQLQTQLLKDIYVGPGDGLRQIEYPHIQTDSLVYFIATPSITETLWVTDGTSANTKGVPAANNIFIVSNLRRIADSLYFAGSKNGNMGLNRLVGSTISSAGTFFASDELYGLQQLPNGNIVFGQKNNPFNTSSIWVTDFTTNGTIKLNNLAHPSFFQFGNKVVNHTNNSFAFTLPIALITDGTVAGTGFLTDYLRGFTMPTDSFTHIRTVVGMDSLLFLTAKKFVPPFYSKDVSYLLNGVTADSVIVPSEMSGITAINGRYLLMSASEIYTFDPSTRVVTPLATKATWSSTHHFGGKMYYFKSDTVIASTDGVASNIVTMLPSGSILNNSSVMSAKGDSLFVSYLQNGVTSIGIVNLQTGQFSHFHTIGVAGLTMRPLLAHAGSTLIFTKDHPDYGIEVWSATTPPPPPPVPAQPSMITGDLMPCEGSTQNYSVISVPGVNYAWTFPSGWTQAPFGGTPTSVIVFISANAGNITVVPSNVGGNGPERSLLVTPIPKPTAVLDLLGPFSPAQGTTVTYSTNQITGFTYTWAVPTGWTILSGAGTSEITVAVGTLGGTVSVRASNICGIGPLSALFASPTVSTRIVALNEVLKISPTITSDGTILMESSEQLYDCSVKLSNASGQVVFTALNTTSNQPLHLGNHPAGIYILQINDKIGRIGTYKILYQ